MKRGSAMTAADRRKAHPSDTGDGHKSTAADCDGGGGVNGRDSGENSPIYHELDPVAVACEPPLSTFHDYQSIVDVRRELVQLRSSGSANSFDSATVTAAAAAAVTPSPSCDDVTGHVTNAASTSGSGSKWTLFSRLRLPRRTAAAATTRQQPGHVISTSGRTAVTSPPHSATAISGSVSTPLSTSWRGENVARADYLYMSTADIQRHLAPALTSSSRDPVVQRDSEVKKRGRRRLVNSSPFSSPCCGVRMAEIRAACRIQSCGPRLISDVVQTCVHHNSIHMSVIFSQYRRKRRMAGGTRAPAPKKSGKCFFRAIIA